jgi:hypothetical protein
MKLKTLIIVLLSLINMQNACEAGMIIGGRNAGTSAMSAAAMNKIDTENRCTNAISRTSSESVTGLFCRLNGTTMNIYLALSDEAIMEIATDPNAAANLSAVRQNLLAQSCRRNSMLLQGSYTTVKYNLVDKSKNEIASYTIHRTECR